MSSTAGQTATSTSPTAGGPADALHVLLVCPSYQPQDVACGVGDYSRWLAEELSRQGHRITVLTGTGYRGTTDGPVRVLPEVQRWSAVEALRRARWVRRGDFDVVDLQYTPVLYGQAGSGFRSLPVLLRLYGAPAAVVTFHSLSGGPASRLWAVLLLAGARRAISANEEVTAMVRRRLARLASKVDEVPIGSNIEVAPVSAADRLAARRAAGVPDGAPLLVHFGLIYPGKGLETLLAALRRVRRGGIDAHLAIVGETRPESLPYRTTLERRAEELDVEGAVHWTGHLAPAEVSRLLHAADLYVVPYDRGASVRRGTLIAGLAHGRPVISTFSDLESRFLRDGDNVSLVPPRDAESLARRILDLLAEPGAAAHLAAGARRLAERFAWPSIARQTVETFRRAIDS